MAASFTIAARNNGFSKADARAATLASVTAYREAMADFAQMPTMDIWYAHLDEDELMAAIRSTVAETKKEAKEAKGKKEKKDEEQEKLAKLAEKRAEKTAAKAHTRDSLQALSKLGEAGRRAVPDRQPAAGRRPGPRPGRHLRPVPGRGHAGDPRAVPRLPGHPAR